MRISATIFFVFLCYFAFSQIDPSNFERDESVVRVVFYNVENIFDPADDPNKRDEEFTPNGDRHWDNYKFYEKLKNTSKAILACGGFTPPEVIGLCEIENKRVLEQLIYATPLKKIAYKISHFESKDRRGIDVGLLYNSEVFTLVQEQIIPINFPWDSTYHTRDILWTQLKIADDTINFFVNHWPSRWGGQLETEDARVFAAQTLKAVTDSLFSQNSNVKIIIMGDFNDSPQNKSIKDVLTGPTNQQFYLRNLMSEELPYPGSHRYQGEWSYLDQMIISKGMLNRDKGYFYLEKSTTPCALPFLLEDDKKYLGKTPFRTFAGFSYTGGFSDHLPIKIDLTKVD